jgi:hypothetical protein
MAERQGASNGCQVASALVKATKTREHKICKFFRYHNQTTNPTRQIPAKAAARHIDAAATLH